MAIELCLEASGFVVQAIEVGWVDHTVMRHLSRRFQAADDRVDELDVNVLADRLPIEQATAVWLVDVCGADYRTGATEMRTSHDQFTRLVSGARQSIRAELDV